jgi:catechol 2,3-dioxygenase-like lactoylglutathione lyase family enzyme
MIHGVHFVLYSRNAEADRAFFREVLGFRAVDAGGGWLIFGMPPSELGIHPGSGDFVQSHADHKLLGAVMYLMCDDLQATLKSLREKKIECAAVIEAEWGSSSAVRLPSGGEIGLYQPKHPVAIETTN